MSSAGAKQLKSCTHKQSCELFPMLSKTGLLKVWQINYCDAAFETCRRFELSKEGKHVPVTLLPNGQNLSALARSGPK